MLTPLQTLKSPLRLLSVLLAAAGTSHGLDSNPRPDPTCKSVPGSAGWPSTETWAKLNESTGGRLLQPPPPGAVCHPGQPTYDAARCSDAKAGWSLFAFHERDPVSNMHNQFSNDSCLPDERDPCSGQGYPVFVVNATTPEHVKLGVNFAREHNIRLIVKSTGHDFLGRSIAPNSLSNWTHHLKGIERHDNFKPKCCGVTIEGGAVTAGAGAQMMETYNYLAKFNETVVGGGGGTVSLGGFLTGGGHSVLSSFYGLASDQILEMQVVTPQGEILTINECSHPDLFWAMRGGGGSTFAIMTSVTVKTYPSPAMTCDNFMIVTGGNSTAAKHTSDLTAYVLSQLPDLGDAGLTGYFFIMQDLANPLDPSGTAASGFGGLACVKDALDERDLLGRLDPLVRHINETWPGFAAFHNVSLFPAFADYYAANYDKTAVGNNGYVASRLLDRRALTENVTALSAAVDRLSDGSLGMVYLVGGEGVKNAEPRGGSNAVLPTWRKAYIHAITTSSFEPHNATARTEAVDLLNYRIDAMRKLAPDMGSYMNEGSPDEPDWQAQFWGENYERLSEVKRAVDPQDVLWCMPCVGNEGWHVVDDVLCRV